MKDKRFKNGIGKHTKPITLTIQNGMPVALVSLGQRKITRMSISDLEILENYSFHAHKRADGKYVARASQGRGPYLHRLIMESGPEVGLEVDHVNADPLDNTRGNLREATTIQNNLAKKTELIYGYSGIVQTQVYSVEQVYSSRGGREVIRRPHKFMAIGPDGQRYGPFIERDENWPEEAAEKAGLKRDELMLEEYGEHYEDHVHHNYGFIRWNGDKPPEAEYMDEYLDDQWEEAMELGFEKLRKLYPREVF